ncbi:hypothetical protein BAE44_0025677 [Dichanthelium oligosanthes]|uniref:RING-type E3 ubiquitin transferase n=1 Tax=Dichanthelium oligosanthes TaxID=888268 RepID=A0A1E5UKA2_9POAL|nr:hypothetical protein BAE44_0025677 [Dichanthelium oligosanthes]
MSRGQLCLRACRVVRSGSSSVDLVMRECLPSDQWFVGGEVLVTVEFAPVDGDAAREHAVGTISSLRTKSDPLFFEALEFVSHGIYPMQLAELRSRMDLEIIILVVSPALSSALIILQLRHAKKHPEAVPAMSITMLAVLALGYLIPLVLNFQPTFDRFFHLWVMNGEKHERDEFPLRVSTMLAFVLQLRLLQAALSGRRPTEPALDGDGSSAVAEKKTFWVCLLLYFLGGVLMLIFTRCDGRPHLSEALSPWFYAGGTVLRAAPHAYDVYASARGDLLGGVAWHGAVLFGVALLAVLLFLQQRVGGCPPVLFEEVVGRIQDGLHD